LIIEKNIDEKTSWKATYSFGYNACQFSARAKIIEYAKSDYIWFIDGDDEIGEIDNFDYDEDIIVFGYCSKKDGDVHLEEQVITENIFSYDTSNLIKPVLWNKFIKRKLFTTRFPDTKIVTNEDSLWLFSALKNAKTVRCVDKIIYQHNIGLSNKEENVTLDDVKSLVTGYKEMRVLLKDLLDVDFYEQFMKATNSHVMSFVPLCDDVEGAVSFFLDLLSKEEFQISLFSSVYTRCKTKLLFQKVFDTVAERYGEDYCYPKITCKVTYDDGRVEDYTFIQTIEFVNN
jgi:glycosyltransferase involved in cell wall biosynthesis